MDIGREIMEKTIGDKIDIIKRHKCANNKKVA